MTTRERDGRNGRDGRDGGASRGPRTPGRSGERTPPRGPRENGSRRAPPRYGPPDAGTRDRGPPRDARSPSEGPQQGPHPKAKNAPEHKVAGKNACRALFEQRRDAIRRVYVTEANVKAFADVLKWCAQQRIAYHVKTDADLDQVAETVHHDGVLFLAREKEPLSLDDVVRALPRDGASLVVLLEDVKNPHNLGAILRVCAHFGVRVVLAAGSTPPLSPAAMRTAEGGAEHAHVVEVQDGVDALVRLKKLGFKVVATTSHTDVVLGQDRLPPRTVILFGSEGAGLSQRLLDAADLTVAIPGSGALESLNVACAASVLLWEHWRARAPAATGASPHRAPRPGRAR